MMSRLLPLLAFFALVALLGSGIYWNLHHDQREVRSPLIDKPAPEFTLPLLYDPQKSLSSKDLRGKPYLINVFGSWCATCVEEHPFLIQYSKKLGVPVIGYNWKDDPETAKEWLRRFGDPYTTIVFDGPGRTAIDFGVYGAPETFLVDARGIIRLKRVSTMTPEYVETELKPAIAKLQAGAP